MNSAELIPVPVLKRKAVVYVRQSTQSQVMTNLESKRQQYDLAGIARHHGFADIEVIDDDLGRSASGTVARPGFDRLVAWLCAGKVGAVLCLEASRLARNGRDWHHLLELCGRLEARVIDHDGVYNPCEPNDRLLLGMKGSISSETVSDVVEAGAEVGFAEVAVGFARRSGIAEHGSCGADGPGCGEGDDGSQEVQLGGVCDAGVLEIEADRKSVV